MPSQISPEVATLVAERLRDDKWALSSFARVSRVFRAPCQQLLFHSVHVRDPKTHDGTPHGRFYMFLKLLYDSPWLGPYVEHLTLEGCWTWTPRPLLDPGLLAAYLSMLPNIRHLDLACVRLKAMEADMLVVPMVSAATRFDLDELGLFYTGGPDDDTGDLLQLLNMFGNINTLHLHGNEWLGSGDAYGKGTFPSNLRVRHLVVNSQPDENPGAWFYYLMAERTQMKKTLRVLSADCCQWDDVRVLNQFLKSVGRNLLQLMIRVAREVEIPEGEHTLFMLQRCPKLRTLRIVIPVAQIGEIFKIFSQLPKTVQEISIRFLAGPGDLGCSFGSIERATLDLLDNLAENLDNLHTVSFSHLWATEQVLLMFNLPKLRAKGLLLFHPYKEEPRFQLVSPIPKCYVGD